MGDHTKLTFEQIQRWVMMRLEWVAAHDYFDGLHLGLSKELLAELDAEPGSGSDYETALGHGDCRYCASDPPEDSFEETPEECFQCRYQLYALRQDNWRPRPGDQPQPKTIDGEVERLANELHVACKALEQQSKATAEWHRRWKAETKRAEKAEKELADLREEWRDFAEDLGMKCNFEPRQVRTRTMARIHDLKRECDRWRGDAIKLTKTLNDLWTIWGKVSGEDHNQ